MRTTQWKWMALGGLTCLLVVIVASKWRESRATASSDLNASPPIPLPALQFAQGPPAPNSIAGPPVPQPVPPLPPMLLEPAGRVPLLPTTEGPPLPGNLLPALSQPFPAPEPQQPMLPPPLPDRSLFQQVPAPREVVAPTPTPILTPLQEPVPPPAPEPLFVPQPQPTPAPLPMPNPRPTGLQPTAYREPPPPSPTPMPAPVQQPTRPVPTTPSAPIHQPVEPGEPPLSSAAGGAAQVYRVRHAGETPREIARKTLGTSERTSEILRLNPEVKHDRVFTIGETVYLPSDACIAFEEIEAIKPLPAMRREAQPKPKVELPLTGTMLGNLDDKRAITLPRSIREQLGNVPMLLVSPGPDQCLWLTNQAHLDRLAERLEKSSAREQDVRVFKRLYYAQTEKLPMSPEGRLVISERLAQFAGLHQEVVLVGIDDHFELWDVARWRQYTQEKSAATKGGADSE